MRREVSKSTDQRYFTRTASHTKAVNLNTRIYRGGIQEQA